MSDSLRRKTDEVVIDLAHRVSKVEDGLAANTALTQKIHQDTSAMVEFFEAAKGAFTVLGWLGKVAKWVTAISAAGAVVWALVKTGTIPTK